MIQGVEVHSPKRIRDNRGEIMRMLRKDDPYFKEFGEIYFSTILPGIIKGWKIHHRMTSNIAVVRGNIRLVLFDRRDHSSTQGMVQELEIGENNYQLICIPPGIAYSFKNIGDRESLLANCATIPHNPEEVETIDLISESIPYKWK